MTIVRIFILIIISFVSFGQLQSNNALVFLNSEEISYNKYLQLKHDSQIHTNYFKKGKATIELFGKKGKNGVISLRTNDYLKKQEQIFNTLILSSLRKKKPVNVIILNGLLIRLNEQGNNMLCKISFEDIEWISEDLYYLKGTLISSVFIQTNKIIKMPFR